ncbi:hypothetical protein U1Q18_033313 [Sarracenia purpurea var. burkii]
MYSEFNLLSFMGISDCGTLFLEKTPNAKESSGSSSRPMSKESDRQIQEQDRQEERKREHQEELERDGILVSNSLRIKIPSLGEFKDDDDGGFRTPTSLDQRIPLIPQCPPPAPRKPKSLIPLKKRKAASRRMLLDLSSEVESLFPASLLADLGGKIKKVRKVN